MHTTNTLSILDLHHLIDALLMLAMIFLRYPFAMCLIWFHFGFGFGFLPWKMPSLSMSLSQFYDMLKPKSIWSFSSEGFSVFNTFEPEVWALLWLHKVHNSESSYNWLVSCDIIYYFHFIHLKNGFIFIHFHIQ